MEWKAWSETAVTCNHSCMLSPRTRAWMNELLLHSPADVQDGGLYSGHRLPSGGLGGWCTYVCLHVNSVLLGLRVLLVSYGLGVYVSRSGFGFLHVLRAMATKQEVVLQLVTLQLWSFGSHSTRMLQVGSQFDNHFYRQWSQYSSPPPTPPPPIVRKSRRPEVHNGRLPGHVC